MGSDLTVKVNEHPFFKALDYVEMIIAFIGMFGMTSIISVHVIYRYVLLSPLQWSEEVSRMLTIWVTFGASSYAFRRGANIGIDALVHKMPEKLRYFMEMTGKLMVIAFFVMIFIGGFQSAKGMLGMRSVAARIPLVLPWSAIPVGSAMVLIRLCQQFYHRFIKKDWKSDVE